MANDKLTLVLDEDDYKNMVGWLNQLSDVDQKAVVASALKGGMKLIVDQGKSNLEARNKVKTGNLKKSFTIRVQRRKNKKTIRGFALGGFKRPKGSHAHFVDKGTDKRWTKTGAYRGSVSRNAPNKGSEFFTAAVDQRGEAALNKLINVVYDECMRITERHSNK